MRADKFFAEKFGSRTKAAEAIEKGWVLINGNTIRPKDEVKETDVITFVETGNRFVSNGGYKLFRALESFDFSIQDKVFADIGASTGGLLLARNLLLLLYFCGKHGTNPAGERIVLRLARKEHVAL